MEDTIVATELDWTIIRPPQLVNQRPGPYRVGVGHTLSRALVARRTDVADYIINSLVEPAAHQQFVSIAK